MTPGSRCVPGAAGVVRACSGSRSESVSAPSPASRDERCGACPEPRRRGGEEETADRRADGHAELKGQRQEAHVAAEHVRRCQIGHERPDHRRVEALADSVDDPGQADHDGRHGRVEPEPAAEHHQGADRPARGSSREDNESLAALERPRERKLHDHDEEGVGEEDQP